MAWNNRSIREAPGFLEQLRYDIRKIPPLPKPASLIPTELLDVSPEPVSPIPSASSTSVPVPLSVVTAAPLPPSVVTAAPLPPSVATAAAVPPSVFPPAAVPPSVVVDTSPTIPSPAQTVSAVLNPSSTKNDFPPTSSSATLKSGISHPPGFKTGPPKSGARKPPPLKPALSKPSASKPPPSKPAASKATKSAVAERGEYSKIKSRPKLTARSAKGVRKTFQTLEVDAGETSEDSNDNTESDHDEDNGRPRDDDQPTEDDDQDTQQPDVSGGYKRRKPVKEDDFHYPPCEKCVRGKRSCNKEAGGGACYMCVINKSRCMYSKSGHKEMSDHEDRDVKDIKGKQKARVRTQRKSKGVEIADDGHGVKGSKSSVKWVDISDDEDFKKRKQPARRTKQAPAPESKHPLSKDRKFSFNRF